MKFDEEYNFTRIFSIELSISFKLRKKSIIIFDSLIGLFLSFVLDEYLILKFLLLLFDVDFEFKLALLNLRLDKTKELFFEFIIFSSFDI